MKTNTFASALVPCLWFDDQAEEAAKFYTAIFPRGKILDVAYYTEGTPGPVGAVMTVRFRIVDQEFLALNGGPLFKFNEAISLMVPCRTQREIDRYWRRLCAGGEPSQCGWLKDRYGVSWQIVPAILPGLIAGRDRARATRVMQAVMRMRKLDLAKLRRAAKGP